MAATAELGVGHTTLYHFNSQFRAAEVTSTLLPSRRGRPAGDRSLDAEREKIIAEEIEAYYLRAERPRLSDLVERIAGRCHQVRVPVPNCGRSATESEALMPFVLPANDTTRRFCTALSLSRESLSTRGRWTSSKSTTRPWTSSRSMLRTGSA